MKLLFDQNLSPHLIERLADLYPNSTHVCRIGLDQATDLVVWNYAGEQGHLIVTQDSDFSDLSALLGFPPKVVWIRRGNCSTMQMEAMLRHHYDGIVNLEQHPDLGVMALF